MFRLLAPVVLVLSALVAGIAADRPMPRADFTLLNGGDVTTLDLHRMSWQQDFRVARLLYEGLTRVDVFTDDYRIIPGVAERWEASADGRVYTFFLRQDARWSDGTPVVAEDFRYSWRRALLPDTGGDYARLFELIRGGKEFASWRSGKLAEFAARHARSPDAKAARDLWIETKERFDGVVGVEAVNSGTLRVELERPTPYFLDVVSFAPFSPVNPRSVEACSQPDPATGVIKTRSDWLSPKHGAGGLVSNGPFVLVSNRFKREMRFSRNPQYWDAASVHLDTIAMPNIEDGNAAVLAFNTGVVDFTADVTPAYRGALIAQKQRFHLEHQAAITSLRAQGLDPIEIDRRLPPDPRKNIHTFLTFGTYFYNFNCSPKLADGRDNPFADPRVRRAFALSLDKEAITRDIRRTGEPPASTFIPVGSIRGYSSPKGLGYDPKSARGLLADAGYPDGKGFITVELLFNKDNSHDLIAQSAAKNWERNLGVSVRLVTKEVRVFREDLQRGNYMISRASWFGDYGDPTTFLDPNRTGDGNNDRKYSSERYDGLLDTAANEPDPARRMAILSEAERIIIEEDLPLIPIFRYMQIYLFDPARVSGISPHPQQVQSLHLVDILGDGKGADVPRTMRK